MACKCDVGLGNTGTVNCQPIATVARKLIFVPIYKEDGTKNFIDLDNDTLDSAYLSGKINSVTPEERWFPLPVMENITQERADSIFETAASGRTAFIREGVKSFFGEVWKESPTFLGKLKESRCVKFGAYVVDKDENFIGYCPDNDGKLYPIAVDNESFDPKLVEATDALVQKVSVAFNWSDDMRDEYLAMITEDDYTFDAINAKGLLDVSATYSAISTTGFTATLSTAYGSKASPVKVKGLLAGDFSLFNVTDSLAVTIISATETADGVYDITYAAQDSTDVLRLTPSKDGFDFAAVVTNTVTIP